MRRRILAFVIAVAAGGEILGAHDFWLASAPWAPAPGARILVTANVGERFPKGDTFTAPERVDQWRVLGANGDIPVAKNFRKDGDSLATDVTLPGAGAYLGVMTISPRVIEMKGDEFTDYLKEEGLDRIVEVRKAAGEAEKPTKERYARYAKVAIRTGAGGAGHLTRPVGLKAEFVPATDPTNVHPGSSLTLQLLADGKPVANAAVTAVAASEGAPVKATTDPSGRVTLKLDREGAWLVKTVHMGRLSGSSEAEWESFWVTLALHTAAH